MKSIKNITNTYCKFIFILLLAFSGEVSAFGSAPGGSAPGTTPAPGSIPAPGSGTGGGG